MADVLRLPELAAVSGNASKLPHFLAGCILLLLCYNVVHMYVNMTVLLMALLIRDCCVHSATDCLDIDGVYFSI